VGLSFQFGTTIRATYAAGAVSPPTHLDVGDRSGAALCKLVEEALQSLVPLVLCFFAYTHNDTLHAVRRVRRKLHPVRSLESLHEPTGSDLAVRIDDYFSLLDQRGNTLLLLTASTVAMLKMCFCDEPVLILALRLFARISTWQPPVDCWPLTMTAPEQRNSFA